MEATTDLERRIAEAGMRLAAERGWARTGLVDVARESGLTLGRFHRLCPSRAALLELVSRQADAEVLAQDGDEAEGETARDRLFDVMMRRFDALLPYRDGLAAVMHDLPAEPLTLLGFSRSFARSMAWMLRAAGIDADGPWGAAEVAGLGAIHLKVMRVWVKDDTADLARTMAALDAELRRAERWKNTLRSRRASSASPPGATPAEPPADASVG